MFWLKVIVAVAEYSVNQVISDPTEISSVLETYGSGYFMPIPAGSTPGQVTNTVGIQLPAWSTATRPNAPFNGEFGFNNTTGSPEAYSNGTWIATTTSLSTSWLQSLPTTAASLSNAFFNNNGVVTYVGPPGMFLTDIYNNVLVDNFGNQLLQA